jgi:hypothetical protein
MLQKLNTRHTRSGNSTGTGHHKASEPMDLNNVEVIGALGELERYRLAQPIVKSCVVHTDGRDRIT